MYCVNQSFGDADDDRSEVLNWDQVTGAGRQKPSVGGARSQLPGDFIYQEILSLYHSHSYICLASASTSHMVCFDNDDPSASLTEMRPMTLTMMLYIACC